MSKMKTGALPRRFTKEDLERAHKNRDRLHNRVWWLKKLLAIDEGELVTKALSQARIVFGRSKRAAPPHVVQERP